MDPMRLTAAGKGKYNPVADNSTEEGRAKNRRTDIILNPDLDKLWESIER
jgi:chemotaxis protein MotB